MPRHDPYGSQPSVRAVAGPLTRRVDDLKLIFEHAWWTEVNHKILFYSVNIIDSFFLKTRYSRHSKEIQRLCQCRSTTNNTTRPNN